MVAVRRIIRDAGWAADLAELLAVGEEGIEPWMQHSTQVLKRDSHSCVGLLSVRGQLCYLKFYRSKSLLQSLGFQLAYGRGVSSFDMAGRLGGAGLAVPEPRCVVLVPGGMLLLTQGIEGSSDLKSLWLQQADSPCFESLMSAAASALARLHNSGFSHGDCKWANFLWSDPQMLFVDLEAVSASPALGVAQQRDLARFTVNAEDMGLGEDCFQVFLKVYADAVDRSTAELRSLILPELQRLRRRHLHKYGQRGHQLL